jgi:hypothetical protein
MTVDAAWTVSLSASAADVYVNDSVQLTATTNLDLTGTGMYLDMFDQTTGSFLTTCTTGTSCTTFWSEPDIGSHTFIAYVDNDPYVELPPCCIQATSNSVTVTWHARASATFDIAFALSGRLPQFPCNYCGTTFSGTAEGSGNVTASANGVTYEGSYSVIGSPTGSATYLEPAIPICPGLGSASGTVTFYSSATGAIWRTSTPTQAGQVYAASFTLNFTYQRVGSEAVFFIDSGSATLWFSFPDIGVQTMLSNISGDGTGAFVVNPVTMASDCLTPGPLDFNLDGDAALTLR